MKDCVFCKIAAHELPSKVEYEDDRVIVIHDINPKAALHLLAIPKKHIRSADVIDEKNSAEVAHIFEIIPKVAAACGITDNYQILNNCGECAGQTVLHLHFHIMSDK